MNSSNLRRIIRNNLKNKMPPIANMKNISCTIKAITMNIHPLLSYTLGRSKNETFIPPLPPSSSLSRLHSASFTPCKIPRLLPPPPSPNKTNRRALVRSSLARRPIDLNSPTLFHKDAPPRLLQSFRTGARAASIGPNRLYINFPSVAGCIYIYMYTYICVERERGGQFRQVPGRDL